MGCDVTSGERAGVINKAPRHLQAVENEGAPFSLELLFQIASLFEIHSVSFVFQNTQRENRKCRQVGSLKYRLNDHDLKPILATADAIR